METTALVIDTENGLYCPPGDFYIDAWKPVSRTIITHAHSDHARRGSGRYLCSADGQHVLRKRMGDDAVIDTLPYGQASDINGVKISLHPAGHVLGSSQVRLEHRDEVWAITGDYKRQADTTNTPFEVVKCHVLITECTFGLPIFHWRKTEEIATEINAWWKANIEQGRTSMLLAYSLGKAQRVMSLLDESIGPILLHGAVHGMVETYRASGVKLPPAEYASVENAKAHRGRALVICPPAAADSTWARKFSPVSIGVASGWMQVRGFRRRRSADMGFVLSDHVDWPDLLRTIDETGAQRIIATHGYTQQLTRYLKEKGKEAAIYQTRFTDAGEEDESAAEEA